MLGRCRSIRISQQQHPSVKLKTHLIYPKQPPQPPYSGGEILLGKRKKNIRFASLPSGVPPDTPKTLDCQIIQNRNIQFNSPSPKSQVNTSIAHSQKHSIPVFSQGLFLPGAPGAGFGFLGTKSNTVPPLALCAAYCLAMSANLAAGLGAGVGLSMDLSCYGVNVFQPHLPPSLKFFLDSCWCLLI